jgi:TBC1 domain family protein 5
MHELLAPIYHAIDFDSLPDTSEPDDFSELCARRWVAADAWALFDRVMNGAGQWYEWRDSPQRQVPAVAGLVHLNGQGSTEPHVTPILHACNRVQGDLLKSVDPVLWGRLQAEGIEPQMYGMWVFSYLLVGKLTIGHRSRWLRLLFTREFNIDDAMVLWDGLFAVDPSLEVALWICVAMLIRIRNQCELLVLPVTRAHQSLVIPLDYSGQLTCLLRYSSTLPADSLASAPPHHTALLIRQALTLQMTPTPAAGASVVFENHNLLDLPTEVPDLPPLTPRKRHGRPGGRQKSVSETRALPDTGSSVRGSLGRTGSGQLNLPEFAKGLLDRGEALGINKTFMNAVSEIKVHSRSLFLLLITTN